MSRWLEYVRSRVLRKQPPLNDLQRAALRRVRRLVPLIREERAMIEKSGTGAKRD